MNEESKDDSGAAGEVSQACTGVRYSYLSQQFAEIDDLMASLRALVRTGDFTLGQAVGEFEANFAQLIGSRFAIGVGSDTDAIKLSLAALGIGPGDEVITAANTFIATAGAINEIGARPVFVDCDDSFCMDVAQLEAVIGPRTRAIVPVHYTGAMADMPAILKLAAARELEVVEDACQAILAQIERKNAGTWGRAGAFSLHPLKNLNVWGDAGVIVTDDPKLDTRLRLLRNHGMASRDQIDCFGYNSRLDSLHAVVGNWLIGQTESITAGRIAHAEYYDRAFAGVAGIRIPPRPGGRRRVFHLYVVFAEDRDALLRYCLDRGIEAKVHYPVPLYRQPGLAHLGYSKGDFPVSDRHAAEMITLPCDQHLTEAELERVVEVVRSFYA